MIATKGFFALTKALKPYRQKQLNVIFRTLVMGGSGPGSDSNEGIFRINQSTEALPSEAVECHFQDTRYGWKWTWE